MLKQIVKYILNLFPRPVLIKLSLLITPLTSLIFKGSKYHCPVCEKDFRKLLPYGYENVRVNALCPNCLSLERHRLLWIYLKNETKFFTDHLKVLHVAPEQSFYKRFKKLDNLEYITGDLESPLAMYKFDIQSIPFENNSFDVVICNHVLEHVPDFKKAASEIYRVLKKDGYAILQVPTDKSRNETFEDPSITDPRERRRIFGQYDHVRIFGKNYPSELEKTGFTVKEKNYPDTLDKQYMEHLAIDSQEILMRFYKS
jgi:SAM-dependent methyltransferase